MSKFRLTEALEPRRRFAVPGFEVCRVSFSALIVEARVYPSFAKEGWTRPKEKCCEASFVERTGWLFQGTACYSQRVWIIGGLKQPPPSAPLRNGAFFFMAQPPLLREGGD